MFKLLKLILICTIFVSSQMVMGDVTFKVVSNDVAKYPVGKMLTEKTKINLQQGDKIRVEITKDNKKVIYTFDGPYNTEEKSDDLIETIKKIFGTKRAVIAKYEQLKDSMLLVVAEDSNFCYASDAPLKLWRSNAEEEIEVSINDISLDWEEDKDILEFPVDKLPKTGSSHLAKIGEDSSISLHKIPTELISNTSKGKWMIENGCVRQAKLLFQIK